MRDINFLVLTAKAIRENDGEELLAKVKEYGESQPHYKGASPLYIACTEGSVVVTQYLLQKTNSTRDLNRFYRDKTPLMNACALGHTKIARFLLQQPTIEPSLPNKQGETALQISWKLGQINLVALLLSHSRILQQDIEDLLQLACQAGSIRTVRLILQKTATDINSLLSSDGTPLMIACRHNQVQLVRFLLRECDIDPQAHQQYTLALLTAQENGLRKIKSLLSMD